MEASVKSLFFFFIYIYFGWCVQEYMPILMYVGIYVWSLMCMCVYPHLDASGWP